MNVDDEVMMVYLSLLASTSHTVRLNMETGFVWKQTFS